MDANTNPNDTWEPPAGENQQYEEVKPAPQAEEQPPEPNYIRVEHAPAHPYAGPSAHQAATGKKRPGLIGLMLAAMLLLGMLLGGAGAGAVMLVAGQSTPATPTQATAAPASSAGSASLVAQISPATINSIYKSISPSVVMISSIVQSGNSRFSQSGEAIGTGLVINSQGYILTNYHVVNGASSVKIELANGTSYTAQVVGTAPQDDLAILKSDAPSGALVPARLGDSSAVQVGDSVVAVGYPYGLDQSVTSGIVSGLNRDGSSSSTSRTLTGLIQVDAAINPGNSGGPLLNAQGEVIGINTMIESPVEGFTGVGLAIPINQAKSLLQQLEQGGQVQRPWLGISGIEIDQAVQARYNLPVSQGILVVDVSSGSPADKAGLQGSNMTSNGTLSGQVGDIITAIDGHKVASIGDLTTYLNTKKVEDKVELTIVRNGQQQTVSLTLQAWSGSAAASGN